MSDLRQLEAIQALHRELLAVRDHRFGDLQILEQLLDHRAEAFEKLLDKPPRNPTSRTAVGSGKIKVDDEEFQINEDFVNDTLKLADELDLDELEAARVLLDANAEGDAESLTRPLWECGVIRFHQERQYLLDCMRLCIEISNDENLEGNLEDRFASLVSDKIYRIPPPGPQRRSTADKIAPRCMAAMQAIKASLQSIGDRMAARSVLTQAQLLRPIDQEAYEIMRLSLVQQHELVAHILCSAIEKHAVSPADFEGFIGVLKKTDRYDHFLVHLFPVLGAYITCYGSTEGLGDIQQSRQFNEIICKQADDDSWAIPSLGAAVRAWWIAEYSGWYLDDTPYDVQGINLDKEDEERTKQFTISLKDGAFDFILSVAADSRTQEWQDSSRLTMRKWLQRKSPPLASDPYPFAAFFQQSLAVHLEVFVDAFISNLPDILRKLRTEEDEQRQLSQTHEQDLDLERFLIIISYAYDGRPDAAMSFWEDPDSNLAGFLQWASRRASTPLVSAFCEMLQALSENEECATAAHNFLLDEGHHSSGKMKRSLSLTWSQIFKELDFFTAKLRERPSPAQTHIHRPGKFSSDQAETEPESAMMLECYLRLISKLASESEVARHKLMADDDVHLVDTIFKLASGNIPPRLRSCAFNVLRAFLSRKSQVEADVMWRWLDSWLCGGFASQPLLRSSLLLPSQGAEPLMEAVLQEISEGFEEPNAFVQLLTSLFAPIEGQEGLNDSLPFPEDLGAQHRIPGVEIYVDYVFGRVFSAKSREATDPAQLRVLRLSCLEFALTCLSIFNEDLIVLGSESSIAIDAAIATSDLATYVRLHPFARVMEWMFSDKVIAALISTIDQDSNALANAAPESPLLLSILRAIEVMLKVFELQETYFDLVRPAIKKLPGQRRPDVANSAYSSFEDGIINHLSLVVNLGRYCGLRQPDLTLACLKLLEKISTSSKIISAWSPDASGHGHRNKAIVQLEKNGESETIAASLSAELSYTLDPVLETDAPNYMIKLFILDFLYECLRAAPNQPTIAHLLLGFRCGLNALNVEPRSAFDSQKSLFHSLLNALIGFSVFQEEIGMRGYLITLKYKILRVFQALWTSPLSSALVMAELRETNFLFHMLLQEMELQPQLVWDGVEATDPEFPVADVSVSFIQFLGTRAMIFEYISKELCSVSQNRIPAIKRNIFDALNGQIRGDSDEPVRIASIFDLFDFLGADEQWNIPTPMFEYYKDFDLSACVEEDPDLGLQYNIRKVQELLLLKRNELRYANQIIPQQQIGEVEREEALLKEYLIFSNRRKQFISSRLKLLRAWTNIILVMFESNDFKGTPKTAFLLQALQSILPNLEAFGTLSPPEAFELARVAKVLLFKLDFSNDDDDKDDAVAAGLGQENAALGNLISDKLFQLFQVCLNSIGKWAASPELRALYYGICYRYLTGVVDKNVQTRSGRARALKAIQAHGERLLSVICDDAYSSDAGCQTAATILLSALVHLGRAGDDPQIVDVLNRLNFIGVLVDSLKTILIDWLAIITNGDVASEQYTNVKLALLLQLCQTRAGAKFVLQANLFRALELSKVFAADPELEIDASNTRALEKHYTLLVCLARVISAAVLTRGNHNILQGRNFLAKHRSLVAHTLKRSAGIGTVGNGRNESVPQAGGIPAANAKAQAALDERIEDLAEAFMLLITATGFLEAFDGHF
ncbi:nucleoporin Nup186/Nup192/Nup205 [Lasiosphaeria ovina]|uniref:Nucleoporin Nup186/Nup192/Nup205 n=1 Tax=Lasiosphaeria ovina TaxID=92902 RepID=A0AAE0NE26_9PEZI|nr:nucleoporin Nup186/Nup192/Nup205 [Lasiosphaeria ovina]